MAGMENNAKTMAVSNLKTSFTKEEKDKAEANAISALYKNPRYRKAHFERNQFYPDLGEGSTQNVRKFDNKFGTQ
jgi:hypothetical protein